MHGMSHMHWMEAAGTSCLFCLVCATGTLLRCSFRLATFKKRRWDRLAVFLKADLFGTLAEALPADVDIVLADQASPVGAHLAAPQSLAGAPGVFVHSVRHLDEDRKTRELTTPRKSA